MTDQAQRLRELATGVNIRPSVSISVKKATGRRCVGIAVTSGKGGVGKTTLSLVLAASLAKMQKKVLMMDADLGLANIHLLLGIAPKFNISHVVNGECAISDIVIEAAPGMYLAPGASGLEKLANLDIGRIERLRKDFMGLEAEYDYLIMDTSAGIGTAVTGFARYADLVLIVMTPDDTSIADAYAMIKALHAKGDGWNSVAVAVNMVSNVREGREAFNKLNTMTEKFLNKPAVLCAILPNDSGVQRLNRKQLHLVGQGAGNKFYKLTSMLAEKIGDAPAGVGSGFFERLFGGAGK